VASRLRNHCSFPLAGILKTRSSPASNAILPPRKRRRLAHTILPLATRSSRLRGQVKAPRFSRLRGQVKAPRSFRLRGWLRRRDPPPACGGRLGGGLPPTASLAEEGAVPPSIGRERLLIVDNSFALPLESTLALNRGHSLIRPACGTSTCGTLILPACGRRSGGAYSPSFISTYPSSPRSSKLFCTRRTPSTFRATCSARRRACSSSTKPFS